LSALVLCRFAGRDDPDAVSSPAVDDDEDPPQPVGPYRDESLLVWVIFDDRQGPLVEEHFGAICEIQAVLATIRGSLVRVPFEVVREKYVQAYILTTASGTAVAL